MAEPEAAARQRRHVGYRHHLGAERLLEEGERIDDPLGAPGSGLLVDEISVRGVAAPVAGQHHAAGEELVALAVLQDQVRGNVGAEGPDDRKRRQHRIERALEADERVAMQDAGAVGEVDHAPRSGRSRSRRTSGWRRRTTWWPDGSPLSPRTTMRAPRLTCSLAPAVERGRRRAPEPGDDAANIRGPLRARQPGIDVPIGDDEAEIIERHLGEAVNPGLVRPRFLAAVVDREDFAPHRLLGAGSHRRAAAPSRSATSPSGRRRAPVRTDIVTRRRIAGEPRRRIDMSKGHEAGDNQPPQQMSTIRQASGRPIKMNKYSKSDRQRSTGRITRPCL